MKLLDDFPAILQDCVGTTADDWYGYECVNAVQSLTRLSKFWGTYEVQLNWIKHSEVPHVHNGDMVSLILDQGYGWFLQQFGASQPLYQFAAPGSVVTMGPQDTHWIPESGERSLSLCVFEKASDWHLHYAPLEPEVKRELFDRAQPLLCRATLPMKAM